MKIVIMQSRYGPYHIARLKAARKYLAPYGMEIYGIQIASRDEYLWEEQPIVEDIPLVTVCENASYQELSRKNIKDGTLPILEHIQPHVVVTNGYIFPEAIISIAWCRRNKKGVVVACDSKRNDAKRIWPKEFVKRIVVSACDAAYVSGALSEEYLLELGMNRERIFKGYDCVDNDFFGGIASQRSEKKFSQKGTEKFFISASRFIRSKNILGLLEAYKKYQIEMGQNAWGLVLAGDGEQAQIIRKYITDNHIENLFLPGFVNSLELAKLFSLSACYIHPGVQETWGLVVNEAMACSLPLLLSKNIGCVPDLLEEGCNGLSFDPASVEDIAKAMLCMTNLSLEQRCQMGKRSKEIIDLWGLENFSRTLHQAIITAHEFSEGRSRNWRPYNVVLRWLN
jgi:glycosyltransferase involved in cell wall biosynthesis